MKQILNQLFEHKNLTRAQSREVLINISQENYNPSQIAAFISVYLMRNISVEELAGFRDALLELCIPLNVEGVDCIDVCGTGGDGKNTFNISTSTAFVIAGAGYKVVKHGNYGVSSLCGSSNVLENLGIRFTNNSDFLKKQLDEANICFLHAPLFHPALKSVGPIRRQLGVKTFFNMLGPLVNPAQPNHQMVGVFNLKLARLYQYLHQKLERRFTIVHSIDGYDEISLTGPTKLISNEEEKLVLPGYFGQRMLKADEIFGGNSIQEASDIFLNVLSGKGSDAQEAVVLANSATAILCFEPSKSVEECTFIAKQSIHSGNAMKSLKKLIS